MVRGASAPTREPKALGLGPALAGGQFLAAACDAVENTALLAVLGGRRGHLPALARAAATLKFSLVGIGAAYVALGAPPER